MTSRGMPRSRYPVAISRTSSSVLYDQRLWCMPSDHIGGRSVLPLSVVHTRSTSAGDAAGISQRSRSPVAHSTVATPSAAMPRSKVTAPGLFTNRPQLAADPGASVTAKGMLVYGIRSGWWCESSVFQQR